MQDFFFFISQMKIHRPRGRKASWVTLSAHQPISVQGRFLSSLCTLDVILSQKGSLKFVFHCFQEFVIQICQEHDRRTQREIGRC